VNEATNWRAAREQGQRTDRRLPARLWVVLGTTIAAVGFAWLAYSYRESDAAIQAAAPKPLPQVVVSKPLVRELDSRLGFLGQFSAVDQVELRAQVGGTLTGIHFNDGDIVHKGDLLFTIDTRPYEIRLAQANAQLETATAQVEHAQAALLFAQQQAARFQWLAQKGAGRAMDEQEWTSQLRQQQAALESAKATVDDAKAQIRDAQFDLDHCHIAAP